MGGEPNHSLCVQPTFDSSLISMRYQYLSAYPPAAHSREQTAEGVTPCKRAME